MPYLDILFPEDISFGGRRLTRYSTTVVRSKSGVEQRNKNWAFPLVGWEFDLSSWDEIRREELADFLEAIEGKYDTFRFKDPRDFYAGGEIDDLENFTPVTPQPFAVGDGETVAFQLRKSRTKGAKTVWRKVTKPDLASFSLYVDVALVDPADYSVDAVTGLVTFNEAPADEAVIAWAGKYWIEARVDSDDVTEVFESFTTGEFTSIVILEVRR